MQSTDKPSFLRVNARGLIVIAALVAILIVVLIVQFAGGAATSTADGEDSAGTSEAGPTSSSPAGAAREKRQRPARQDSPDPWSPISLEDVIGHDPFRILPVTVDTEPVEPSPEEERDDEEDDEEDVAESRRQAEAARQAALAALTQRGVGAFMSGGKDGNVAVIGDRTVRAGDVIDGFRVIAVEPDGVIVEPIESP